MIAGSLRRYNAEDPDPASGRAEGCTAELSVRLDLTHLRLFVQVAEICSIASGVDLTHV